MKYVQLSFFIWLAFCTNRLLPSCEFFSAFPIVISHFHLFLPSLLLSFTSLFDISSPLFSSSLFPISSLRLFLFFFFFSIEIDHFRRLRLQTDSAHGKFEAILSDTKAGQVYFCIEFCCGELNWIVLGRVVLWCVVLCRVVLWCVVLWCVVLCCVVFYDIVLCRLCCIGLPCSALN